MEYYLGGYIPAQWVTGRPYNTQNPLCAGCCALKAEPLGSLPPYGPRIFAFEGAKQRAENEHFGVCLCCFKLLVLCIFLVTGSTRVGSNTPWGEGVQNVIGGGGYWEACWGSEVQ